MENRTEIRNPTAATVGCRPFTLLDGIPQAEGVMHNYSPDGTYIESSQRYSRGSVLVVRILEYPASAAPLPLDAGFRSIGLAEIKWVRQLDESNSPRYGLGLKYLQ